MKMKYIGIVAVMAVLCLFAAPVLGEKNANAGPKGDQTCCVNPDCEQNSHGPQYQGGEKVTENKGHGPQYRNPECPNRKT
jgi:hypothetical protein